MAQWKATIATILTVVIATNCSLAADKGNKKQVEPQRPIETRVYIRRQCLLGEERVKPKLNEPGAEIFGAIAAIFVPMLIERLIGGIGGALKKAGDEQTLKDSGRLPIYLYHFSRSKKVDPNPDLGCVIAVRGQFSEPDPLNVPEVNFSTNGIFASTTEHDESKRIVRLRENGVPVQEIAAVYEAEMTPSDDNTALKYQPKFFEMKKFQGSRSSDKRGVVVTVGIIGAGEKEGEPVLSLAMMNLGEVSARQDKNPSKSTYTVKGPNDLKSKRSSWLGGFVISQASMKAIEKLAFPAKPTDPNDPEYKHFLGVMPVTIEATFVETEDGNKALKFIGEILEASKGDLAETLSGEILKDRGKEATEAADALEKLRQDERVAYGEYLSAEADLAKLKDPTEAERQFRRFEANRKKALWCGKYLALLTFNEAPSTRSCTESDLNQ